MILAGSELLRHVKMIATTAKTCRLKENVTQRMPQGSSDSQLGLSKSVPNEPIFDLPMVLPWRFSTQPSGDSTIALTLWRAVQPPIPLPTAQLPLLPLSAQPTLRLYLH
mmetsp:Transcript_16767/g.37607  ORF Transcript_16767/g.37607 Transcript_16767/m.37607 type:complete len:109 (-) Transcript_16767:39-365(-)